MSETLEHMVAGLIFNYGESFLNDDGVDEQVVDSCAAEVAACIHTPEGILMQRDKLITEIGDLLPKQQEYFTAAIPYLDSLKYIDEGGHLSYSTSPTCGGMHPYGFEQLPLDSLVVLKRELQQARWNQK